MVRRLFLILPLLLILVACGPAQHPLLPVLPFITTLTPGAPTVREGLNTSEKASATSTAALPPPTTILQVSSATGEAGSATPSAAAPLFTDTPTAIPSYIPYLPTPTETLLPPLELPTEQPKAPAFLVWTGLPSYPADSDPGTLFKVEYDPNVWAQTEGNFGVIVLANRQIEYCTITPWAGRGLPVDWKVSHEFRVIGSISYDVSTVTSQGAVQFVSYVGGDGHVLTGFQVTFKAQPDACLQAAETVMGSLRSLTAIPTPTIATVPAP